MTPTASQRIRAMVGARIPGGCAHCDAYQTVQADAYGPNLHRIAVNHDHWCPWLTAKRGGRDV